MKTRFVILAIVCFFLASCNKQIIQLENLTRIHNYVSGEDKGKLEYFVVANPPEDKDALIDLALEHFQSFVTIDTIESYYSYCHLYYKETRFTPRDYKEEWKGYFNHDYIDNHIKDLLLEITIKPMFNMKTIILYKNGDREEKIETKWKE